jgi:predicted nucleic acid-binding protein
MKILLDTNILVHAYNKSSPHQKRASNIIKQAMKGEIEAYLTAQVIYEFFAVVTNPKRVECPMKLEEAADLCLDLWECREIAKVNPTSITPKEVFKLVKEIKLAKGKIFDCIIAVTSKENNIDAIYTENVDDFEKYSFIKVINPLLSQKSG